ncbi:MAG: ABC transporter substrate-binding protein [Actinomyces sp.]|nr:MAG: ABC transporter substrate-binding protein [Actinomyces sp.]
MSRSKKLLVACVAIVALVAAACGDDDSSDTAATGGGGSSLQVPALADVLSVDLDNCAPAPEGDPLIIGYAADKSEVGGFVDIPGSQAADLFVDMINCAGGVGGHPVEFIVQDIQGDPEVTQRAARDLLDAGAQVILGPPFADFGQPLLQVTGGDVPVLFVASTEPSLPDPAALSFLVTFDDTRQAETAAQFALDQGFTRAITFSAPGPYFGYNPEVFTRAFEEGGGEVVIDETYVPFEDTDFSTQVNEVAGVADGSEILYTAMIADQLSILRGQLEAQGVDIAYLGADAFEATGIVAVDNNEGVYYTTHAWAGPGTPLRQFLDVFEQVNGEPIENSSFGGLAADAVWIAVNGFADSGGSSDPAAIGAAIAELQGLSTVTGSITYAGTNGVPDKPVYIHQIVNGEPTLAATYG